MAEHDGNTDRLLGRLLAEVTGLRGDFKDLKAEVAGDMARCRTPFRPASTITATEIMG